MNYPFEYPYEYQREVSQIRGAINWLEKKIETVKEEMIRRPSKIRHLNDLIRQKNQQLAKLKNIDELICQNRP